MPGGDGTDQIGSRQLSDVAVCQSVCHTGCRDCRDHVSSAILQLDGPCKRFVVLEIDI